MDDRSQEILDSLPQRGARSRLAPYRELIHELRRRRRTYREIVQVLAEKCHCCVSISTLHDFVRIRSRAKRESAQPSHADSIISTKSRSAENPSIQTAAHSGEHAGELSLDVQERIAALRNRPAPSDSISNKLQYDPDEPLHLPSNVKGDRDST